MPETLREKRRRAGKLGAAARWGSDLENGKVLSPDGTNGTRPAENRDWYRIESKATDEADVYIYGMISRFDVNAKDFANELAEISAKTLNVFINSPGGSVFEGLAIMNAIHRHPASVNVVVDGIAASAASFIAMSGDTITMARGSQMMIHDALTVVDILAMANPADIDGFINQLEALKKNLDRHSDNVAALYAEAASARGGESDPAAWRALMTAETWYFAEEAVDAGLADKVEGNTSSDDDPEDSAPIELKFRYASREKAPPPRTVAATAKPAAPAPAPPAPEPEPVTPAPPKFDLAALRAGLKEVAS